MPGRCPLEILHRRGGQKTGGFIVFQIWARHGCALANFRLLRGDSGSYVKMKIAVIGCAAVGRIFAAHLPRASEPEGCAYNVSKNPTNPIRTTRPPLSPP